MSGKNSLLACSVVLALSCVLALVDVVYSSILHTSTVEDHLDTTEFLNFAQENIIQQATPCKTAADCGNSSRVSCEYDNTAENRTVCKCDNDNTTYVPEKQLCMGLCKSIKDCNFGGQCRLASDGLQVCSCYRGNSGDFCEIRYCDELCGESPGDVQCEYSELEKDFFCVCPKSEQGFDYNTKNCTECDCGYHSYRCDVREGKKICLCQQQAYKKDDQCIDCDCGSFESYTTCEFPEGKKKCLCKDNYKLNNGTCQSCDCGWFSEKCEFHDGKTVCTCESHYLQNNRDYCSECDCGVDGTCTFDANNKKVCTCDEGYTEYRGTCKSCRCSGSTQDSVCSFDSDANIVCNCSKGYQQKRGSSVCEECDCGKNGKCSFAYRGTKQCDCNSGYKENYGVCEACDCGGEGRCIFSDHDKVCYCNTGYAVNNGTCQDCSCGEWNSYQCLFDSNGQKKCTCKERYALLNGICESCSECYFNYKSCVFNSDGTRNCNCTGDYEDKKGVCTYCNCGSEGISCSFDGEKQRCKCQKGYYDDRGDCSDIDECEVKGICPSTTECRNLPGDYTCECLKGYKETAERLTKTEECQDINECSVMSDACISSGAICINSPGSYRCGCIDGYKEAMGQHSKKIDPKYQKCVTDDKPFRTATIVFGVLFGVIAVGAVCFLIKRHMK